MDINRSNPLEAVMESLLYFYEKTGNKITFEYVLLDKVNDSLEDAEALCALTRKVPAFVNIIEYNAVDFVNFKKTPSAQRDAFANYLRSRNVNVAIRRSRGKDIDAACGQLANKHEKA